MTQCSIEPRTREFDKGYRFLSVAGKLSNKYENQLLEAGLDFLKMVPKK